MKMWYMQENIPLCHNRNVALAEKFITRASKLYINIAMLKDQSRIVPNEELLRTVLANFQNSSEEVCGQCVATLYADDDCY